jgi:two-component system repressor protein LuxO
MQQALIFREVLVERSLLRHTLEQVQAKRKRHFQHFIGHSTPVKLVVFRYR